MKRSVTICVLAGLVVAVAPAAWGNPFDDPPESNPDITWQTAFPYQRNIRLDFNVNPVGGVGPIPGAVYGGSDDSLLWDSDYVEMTGDVEWNAALGAVGIFDSPAAASGTLIIHLDNWIRDLPVKHVYDELTWYLQGDASIDARLELPTGSQQVDYWADPFIVIVPPGGLATGPWHTWTEVEPNPPWEDKIIYFETTAGSSAYVDNVHIATECVPVPGAVLLGMIGLSVAGVELRKFA